MRKNKSVVWEAQSLAAAPPGCSIALSAYVHQWRWRYCYNLVVRNMVLQKPPPVPFA
jgi:hypothetical protein